MIHNKLFTTLFKELDNAINVLTSFSQNFPNSKILASYDLVYQGTRKWIQFANSLKLRLAMRIVYADPAKAKLYAESAVNHPIGVIKLLTPVLPSNLLLQILSEIQFLIYAFNMTIFAWGQYGIVLKGFKDPRISSYFNQATIGGKSDYFGIEMVYRLPINRNILLFHC